MAKQKFATQVDSEVLEKTRAIAHAEGKQLQAIVEEALLDLIEKRHSAVPAHKSWRCTRQASPSTNPSTSA